jgi:hypothetical protein
LKAIRLSLLLLLAAAPLVAQQRWERQVRERLDRAIVAVRGTSRHPVVTRSGVLNAEESASFQTPLVQATSYAILAVCDDDCSRLELTLVTPSGSEIAKDRSSESLPTLHFTPPQTMVYGVRVVMEGCHWNPCWYAVAIVPVGAAFRDARRTTPEQ